MICKFEAAAASLTLEFELDPLALAGLPQKFDKPGQDSGPPRPLDAKEIAPRRQGIDVMINTAIVLLALDEQIDGLNKRPANSPSSDLERNPYALPPEVDDGARLRRLGDLSYKEAAER